MCPAMLLSGCPVSITIRPATEVDLELLTSSELGWFGSVCVSMAILSHAGPKFGVTITVFRTSYGLRRHSITSTAAEGAWERREDAALGGYSSKGWCHTEPSLLGSPRHAMYVRKVHYRGS